MRSDFRYITAAVNANRDLFEMNQRNYARRCCGVVFDLGFRRAPASQVGSTESDRLAGSLLRLPVTDSVLVDMPLEGLRAGAGGGRP